MKTEELIKDIELRNFRIQVMVLRKNNENNHIDLGSILKEIQVLNNEIQELKDILHERNTKS